MSWLRISSSAAGTFTLASAAGVMAMLSLQGLNLAQEAVDLGVAALGLPAGAKTLRLSQIKARALLVEVYSLYCPQNI